MPIELRVPALGESITQATIGAWLKKEGEAVKADEPLVEVESEKATVAVPAPSAGVLMRVLKQSGAQVEVGEVIAVLEEGAAARAGVPNPAPATPSSAPVASAAPAPVPPPLPAPPAPAAAPAQAQAPAPQAAAPAAASAPAAAPTNGSVRLPPSARRRLAEGREDPRAAVLRSPSPSPSPQPAPQPLGERERAIPMTPLRRTVARRLLEAQQTAAILTTFNELDMSKVMALREKHGAAFLEKHGVKLGFMSFFVKAAVEALRAFPGVNGEIRGQEIVYKDHYDIGVAVGGGKGLVVPVLRDADTLSFSEIEKALGDLAKKARENRITMADLEGGTFTISNGGIYGSLLSTPILNPPQSGILGLHKIEKRAVVGPGDTVVVRPMMYVALSYDHRLVDGREAVSFLVRVKDCIEDPERLLLEI